MSTEKTIVKTRPKYREYIQHTSSFFPWSPKKEKAKE
jgi:steroid 5-alpha reductase family enzyme